MKTELQIKGGLVHTVLRRGFGSEVEFWCGKQRDDAALMLPKRGAKRCHTCADYIRNGRRYPPQDGWNESRTFMGGAVVAAREAKDKDRQDWRTSDRVLHVMHGAHLINALLLALRNDFAAWAIDRLTEEVKRRGLLSDAIVAVKKQEGELKVRRAEWQRQQRNRKRREERARRKRRVERTRVKLQKANRPRSRR